MTTNPLHLAQVRAIKEEANVILDSKHWGEMKREAFMERLQHTPALYDTIETLVEALRLVVDSPHEVYNKAIAELLATINPRSAEAQTEGDMG